MYAVNTFHITSCEMSAWMNHKLESRSINNLRCADDTTLMAEKEEEFLMKVKEESESAGLNLNIKKLRLWHPVPSLRGK